MGGTLVLYPAFYKSKSVCVLYLNADSHRQISHYKLGVFYTGKVHIGPKA